MSTYVPIFTQNISSAVTSVTLSGIPQTYTDLVLVVDATLSSGVDISFQMNGDGSALYSRTYMFGNGSTTNTDRNVNLTSHGSAMKMTHHFMNYSNTTQFKSGITRYGTTNSNTLAQVTLWRNTNPITSVTLTGAGGSTFQPGSTFTLYGIGSGTAKATGGEIYISGTTAYHVFKQSGVFTPLSNISADILVIAGGGGSASGGAGAGGLLAHTSQSLTTQTAYTVTVGAGGASNGFLDGFNGNNSRFGSLTASVGGGGGGGGNIGVSPAQGGSGGGSGWRLNNTGLPGGLGTPGQGNNGGAGGVNPGGYGAGGGGGAGAPGGNANGTVSSGNGGNGVSTYSAWGLATNTGQNLSGTVWYAGGGGGGLYADGSGSAGLAGNGGGGAGQKTFGGAGNPGMANTGGGAGSGANTSAGSSGGSGIVIVRYTL